ncbi:MAG: hypothetical protein BGN88_04130 [Clostridiales bacterium 43-6]|nr:MAG: hypothetical protein BGN88_04130 [Clostridiales bacterium 43-6]
MPDFSIFSYFGYSLPLNERFRLIRNAGFSSTFLWWGMNLGDDIDKHHIPDMARKNGLTVENIHTPFDTVNSLWEDGRDGEDYLSLLLSCIDDCKTHAIGTAVVHLSRTASPPPISPIGLERVKRLIDHAETQNINIAMENLNRPEYLDYIFEQIDSEKLGFCFDSGHENCFTPDRNYLAQYGHKLMALHLHDNNGERDLHLLPFDGTTDWNRVAHNLTRSGYNGALSLEVEAGRIPLYDGLHAEEFLKKAYQRCAAISGLHAKTPQKNN